MAETKTTFKINNVAVAKSSQACTGNAATATKLSTARNISIGTGATGIATAFDGSADITIPVTSLDAEKLVGTATINTTGNANTANNATHATNADNATTAANCTGNAATATKLATARTITLSGTTNGNASFDGSTNVTITTTAGA